MTACLPRSRGIGVDVHSFAGDGSDRALWVAGLHWPDQPGLDGHSDADVAAHAACDALFSAAGIGDLGAHFGTDRPELAGASGATLLAEAARLVRAAGFEIGSPREPARRGGTVLVRTPDNPAVHKELGERNIICDFRPDAGVRLGPHFFNSEDELRHTVVVLTDIVESGAYARHQGAAARF